MLGLPTSSALPLLRIAAACAFHAPAIRARAFAPGPGVSTCIITFVLAGLMFVASGRVGYAVTSDSPEVKAMVDAGLKHLATITDHRLGGKCVIGLAFVKAKRRTHPQVQEAVQACREKMERDRTVDVYSNGLAVVFLCELDANRYRTEIQYYLDMLMERQKDHGGWGYDANITGDTSQTQYAALAIWEANRHGFDINPVAVEELSKWLLRTQDPSGTWGYQGVISTSASLVAQTQTSVVMYSAGLGSLFICFDLAGSVMSYDGQTELNRGSQLPSVIEGQGAAPAVTPKLTAEIDEAKIGRAAQLGDAWMEKNYKIETGRYNNYYLYTLERFKSFQELYNGISPKEPQWYNDGYEFLKGTQTEKGGWPNEDCGEAVDTAFAILFLLRSTKASIRANLEGGTLVGGQGLPSNVAAATVRRGQIVVQQTLTKVDEMFHMIDDDQRAALDDLARNPASLIVGEVDQQSARRLRQLVRAREPEVRLLAVRSLARAGNLDYVPTLLYAMTDPDQRIVLEARDGLRFVSRRFEGFGLPDSFNEKQRYAAIDQWKEWYRSLRPDAVFE